MALAIVPGAGCVSEPGLAGNTMATEIDRLYGKWEKIAGPACSGRYPQRIEFERGGLYKAQPEQPGRFTIWDIGTYVVAGPSELRMSTAGDAVVPYGFSLRDEVLMFRDPQGCEYSYRRVHAPGGGSG